MFTFCCKSSPKRDIKNFTKRILFSACSGKKEISINEKKIFFYVKLTNLEIGKPYKFTCKIHDGAGTLLFENTSASFTSKSNSYLRWCWLKIDKFTEEPGMWKFDGLIDGKLITSKTLKVNPAG